MRRPAHKRKSPLRHLLWVIPLLVFDFYLFRWFAARPERGDFFTDSGQIEAEATDGGAPPPPPPVWQRLSTPTPQQNLLNPDEAGVLQPTGSGRLESAKFGSTRTGSRGGKVVPVFHEGVDIAPTQRDRKGVATDPIFAVADGRVAFVNSVAGKSSYGKFVVIEHPDPSLGLHTRRDGTSVASTVYTLYAHLADIKFGIRPGHAVEAGDSIGTIGNTSSTQPPIPHNRSHLHWEIGLLLHSRYEVKHREEKLTPDFGNYHGHNLFGLDPLDFYAAHSRDPGLTMASYLATVPPACEILLRGKYPDFFQRFPLLWKGLPHDGGPIHLTLSEAATPLAGRNATASETAKLGNQRQMVLQANSRVLGNNGRRYFAQGNGGWQFTAEGRAWADILLF